MRVEVVSEATLQFDDGSPVRAASGVAPYAGGWLVLQDDATHACVWRDGTGTRLRLLSPVRGHDVFDEASGTKALKPDLEAVTPLPDGRTLVLGSGSTPARMRTVLLSEAAVVVAGLAPVYARVAEALEVTPDRLNLEGACVVGTAVGTVDGAVDGAALRWFQRGLPSAGSPSASVDVGLDQLVAAAAGRSAGVRVSAVRRYDLGKVAGVGLAVTDAVALDDGRVLVSAVAEDSSSTYDDGPVVGAALALLDGDEVVGLCALPAVGGGVAKVEGLALSGRVRDGLELVAVVDADDPRLPSAFLQLRVSF